MNKCLNCQKETGNPKFCSRSCAAKHNNKIPKRKKKKLCKLCVTPISSSLTYCSSCYKKRKELVDITLGEAIYKSHHKSSAFALVRSRARIVAKNNNMCSCEKCGYDKHVEIAHVKPISSFSNDTMLSEINSLSNLKALCPNCHWEFDHSL